jgi:hypothetical protein
VTAADAATQAFDDARRRYWLAIQRGAGMAELVALAMEIRAAGERLERQGGE